MTDNEQIDFVELRKDLEDYFNKLLKLKLLSIDVLNNQNMKNKLVNKFIEEYDTDRTLQPFTKSMFDNIIKCNILRIPIHARIDLDSYFKLNEIKELDDDEYLRQSLMMMY